MKRVYTLYRVSTLKQVEKNDIPMQKKSCRDFVNAHEDWVISEEFIEKGISGFKTSAEDRDAIQKIKQDAIDGKFDVLLVFMFDRIGRKDDETPFIVEWFANNGIEVWSVMEGEQKFDTHVDKLTNYIRYWQASGESIKTSQRTKTRMGQIVQEGRFKGGVAAYGYKLVKLGRVNKRNREVYDLAINEDEAEIVRLIFNLYVNEGLGTHRLAEFLTKQGIYNRAGDNFVSPTIRNMIKNPMYMGVLRSGESYSEPFDHLQIIDPTIFERAKDITQQRRIENHSTRTVPLITTGERLLSGNIFCGHCGARLVASTAGKNYKKADGTVVKDRYWRYLCYNRTRHKHKCNGQTGYNASNIDEAITKIISTLLSQFKRIPLHDFVVHQHKSNLTAIDNKLQIAEKKLQDLDSNISKLNKEVVLVVSGESQFTLDMLKNAMSEAEREKVKTIEEIESLTEEKQNKEGSINDLKVKYSQLIGWESIFSECNQAQKKMIISQIIDRITISRNNEIKVDFAIGYEQFISSTEKGTA